MVIPLLSEILPGFLTGKSFANWLRTDGAGLFTAFETGAEALHYIRELGSGIRTQTFYQIRREVLAVAQSSQPLLDYPSNQLIPLNWHVTDHGLELSTEFQYRIHLFGADPKKGVLTDQWMTVASNRQLTIDMVKEVASSYVGEGGESGQIAYYHFAEIEPLRR